MTPRHRAGSVDQLLAALVAGHTIATAAGMAGMGEETARRRLREPDVRTRLDELRAATLTAASDRLTSLAIGAAEVLGTVMNDAAVPAAVRVRAAAEVLGRVAALRDAATVEERLTQIETALARRDQWAHLTGRAG
jgi:thioredoxin-like negative regulator of GroEL